jgi:hypothetical protein
MNKIKNDYLNLKTIKEKRLFCLDLDLNKKYYKLLSYDKISEFTVNVCFEKLTNINLNQIKERRHINFKDKRDF